MKMIYITLISIAFLTLSASAGYADDSAAAAVTVQKTGDEKIVPTAGMSDEALASYISGRLAPLLKDSGYAVSQNCDQTGCSVVVQ